MAQQSSARVVSMFLLVAFVYPLVLSLICVGSGLLVERLAGWRLPGGLIIVVGLAAVVALSQLTVWSVALAPVTPYLAAVLATAGFALRWSRVKALVVSVREQAHVRAQIAIAVSAYLVALAPVLLAGRPSFSSYMTLTDSAIHMVGASYLISHGASFGHLDLSNSYGKLVDAYFNTGYPTGADTAFGASARLLGLPMIWAFQPFNAFVLASATGPSWVLARRIGLGANLASVAALTSALPALAYAYELIASVKEVVALALLLAIGAFVALSANWLMRSSRGGIPFAVLAAGGISVLGVGFGVWVLMAAIVLALRCLRRARMSVFTPRKSVASLGAMLLAGVLCALPTWARLSAAIAVTTGIGRTGNQGNLQAPLRVMQMAGTWLASSYLAQPHGIGAVLTDVLSAVTVVAAALGLVHLLRSRRWALGGWLTGSLLVWALLSVYSTAWVDAKGLMLTSPIFVVLAWAGVSALRAHASRRASTGASRRAFTPAAAAAIIAAAAIAGGVLASDALQYHDSALAPTARYEEMAYLGSRFAGRGPALFTDFDEYSLYQLRSLDIGGPDFLFAPHALSSTTDGHSYSVDLERAKPAALARYPLIITRINPLAYRPPAAYKLIWQGTYYQVWQRTPRARVAIAAVGLHGGNQSRCKSIAKLAHLAARRDGSLVADSAPQTIQIGVRHLRYTASWRRSGVELVMSGSGRLSADFRVPRRGLYRLWLDGEAMPELQIAIDGRHLSTISGELSGNGDDPDPFVPIRVRLSAGRHRLTIAREGLGLAPGSGDNAYLEGIYLTPQRPRSGQGLASVPVSRWRSLCSGKHLDWVEAIPGAAETTSRQGTSRVPTNVSRRPHRGAATGFQRAEAG